MKHWWVPGLQIGYEHTFVYQVADFLVVLEQGKSAARGFRDALKADYVTGPVLDPAGNRKWVMVQTA